MDTANLHRCQSMHGVFHSNGFGHLLCINGVELGLELPGFQIMDLWDRLCTGLRARFVIPWSVTPAVNPHNTYFDRKGDCMILLKLDNLTFDE